MYRSRQQARFYCQFQVFACSKIFKCNLELPFVQVLSEILLSDKELQGNSDVLCEVDAKFKFAQPKLEMCNM